MRRRDYFIQTEQRMIGWRRLLLENIQRGAGYEAGFDRLVKRGLINQPATRTVDDPHTLFHFLESLAADNAARLGRQGRVHGQEISARKNIIQRRNFDFEIARLVRSDKWIVPDNLHAERACPRRHGASDPAQTDDSQSLSLQLDTDELLSFPVAFFETLIRLRHAARQRHQQSDRV